MESGTVNLLHMLNDRVKKLCKQGRWEDAYQTATASVDKARRTLDDDPNSLYELVHSVEILGDVFRRHGDLENARQSYLEALELLQNDTINVEQRARINASIAVVYDLAGHAGDAITFYTHSIELFESMNPPALLDVADLCNNLGYLYKSQEDYDTAEGLYLKALQICHDKLGVEDLETASVCNNLGALYLVTGYLVQAREMHSMALEIRSEKLDADDVDVAQSHSNLALVLAQNGDLEGAIKNFAASWRIYDIHAAEEPEDYAVVTENYSMVLRETGNIKKAISIEKRSAKVIKKLA